MLNLSSVTRWAILSFQYLAIQNNENLPKSMTILPNTKNTVTQEKAKKFKNHAQLAKFCKICSH